uniref:E3 ubiquitin-protein ligase HECTD1-like n=1 Tax=Myxine glutinosa TaxID=7769 RepID=UPI00358F986A
MADVNPGTLLEWLHLGQGDDRTLQLFALEQLCMLLLTSDNVDRCFHTCPPWIFMPALCRIFLDEHAPDDVLEVTARAITYYLDMSTNCTQLIVAVDGAVKALCSRLEVVEVNKQKNRDLAEQCVKVLELICTQESGAVLEACGDLSCVLAFILNSGYLVHKDTLHSAMSVVSRLCGKMEPHDSRIESCVEALSILLKHEDHQVSDGALRCFASLADSFMHRGVDPAPLAEHGLTAELVSRLAAAGGLAPGPSSTGTPKPSCGAPPAITSTPGSKFSSQVSTIVSLLSSLFCGSPIVTQDLLRTPLPDAIERAVQGDEHCCLDTMRLVDLLFVLLFEGRAALPRFSTSSASGIPGLGRLHRSVERSHRQLIDCIKRKDTDGFIDAIDTGAFDVNFTDDIGQTLLIWASAFGTQEMVEFLCERGCDVDRGQCSPLHYAAVFGRPQVAKTLLKNGAYPYFRDNDGKTPLDKAQECGHIDVVSILQSPEEWMCSVNKDQDTKKKESHREEGIIEPRGDPEMAPVYLKRFLPIFALNFQKTIVPPVRKASLALICKMVHYCPGTLLKEVCSLDVGQNLPILLVEVTSAVLHHEDDDDGHLLALKMINDLVEKGGDLFMNHLQKLGVINKVSGLAGTASYNKSEENMKIEQQEDMDLEDASDMLEGMPYHWRDWSIVIGRGCLYIWSDAAALELIKGSSGWFRFILGDKLDSMYSNGNLDGGWNSSESRSLFLEKLQRARSQVKRGTMSQPVLSCPNQTKLLVGKWSLTCQKDGEMLIHHSDRQQATILKEDLPGFVFESSQGTKHYFTAETSLRSEFLTGKRSTKPTSKLEMTKQKVSLMARRLYKGRFEAVESMPNGTLHALRNIACRLECAWELHTSCKGRNGDNSWIELMKAALEDLTVLLKEEKTISPYEMSSSGLIQALLTLLCNSNNKEHGSNCKKVLERIHIFKAAFKTDDDGGSHLAKALVLKLISVLESIERLHLYQYDTPGSVYNLQVLTRRLRLRLERAPGEMSLIDRTGRMLQMEPLATTESLEHYLLKMVAMHWFEYDRGTFAFVRKVRNGRTFVFYYQHDFDDNGIIYWIGTNAKTAYEWINPAACGLVVVSSSEGRNLPFGRLEDILSRDRFALNCHTNDDENAWFAIDLGLFVRPEAYTLRHARGYRYSALRNWLFQVSKDGQNWLTLFTHTDDYSLDEPGSTATWPLEPPKSELQGWRHIRVKQMGKNASGQMHHLSLSGFELYGTVTAVCEDQLGQIVSSLMEMGGLYSSRMGAVGKYDLKLAPGHDPEVVNSPTLRRLSGPAQSWRNLLKNSREKAFAVRKRSNSSSVCSVGSGEVHCFTPADGKSASLMESKSAGDAVAASNVDMDHTVVALSNTESLPVSESGSQISVDTVQDTRANSTERCGAHGACSSEPGGVSRSVVSVSSSDVSSVSEPSNKEGVPQCLLGSLVSNRLSGSTPLVSGAAMSSSSSVPNLSSSELCSLMESFRRGTANNVTNNMNLSRSSSDDTTNTLGRTVTSTSELEDKDDLPEPDDDNEEDEDENSYDQDFEAVMEEEEDEARSGRSRMWDDDFVLKREFPALVPAFDPRPGRTNVQQTTYIEIPTPDFLEGCRDGTLTGELEDKDDLPEPDDDNEEDEDENSDDQDFEAAMLREEEEDEARSGRSRMWDDDFVLKREFPALVPAFDPRPGRTNVQQTTYIEIPTPGTPGSEVVEPSESGALHHLTLILKVTGLGTANAVELPLTNPKATIFSNVQKLLEMTSHGELKVDKLWRIWEPTYTILYSEMNTSEKEEEEEVRAESGSWRSKMCPSMQKPSGGSHFPHPFPSPILNLPFEQPQARAGSCQNMCSVEDVLQLLRLLHAISSQPMSPNGFSGEESGLDFIVPLEEFTSKKLTTKILQQIEEPLALASGALPDWCEKLNGKSPFLIPFKTRQLYFNCTAFGVTRTIVWIQNRREASVERERMTSSSRRDGLGEFQVGRLKHERVKFPREDSLMEWAENVMHIHAANKSVLEVEFIGEEGTGVGPTLEFYALLAAEFQQKSLGIWICDDDLSHQVDVGDGLKPPGYYVQHSAGLFPSPLPQDSDDMYRVKKLVYFFGIYLAKCIQDNRRVDIPLSRSFFKLMCRSSTEYTSCKLICDCSNYTCSDISSDTLETSHDDFDVGSEDEDEKSEFVLEPPKPRSPAWFHKVLTWEKLEEMWPQMAKILRELKELAVRRRQILGNRSLLEDARNTLLQDLELKNSTASGSVSEVEDLGLTFQFYPSSKVYGFSAVDLKPNGEDEMVTMENAEEYVDLMLDFCLHSGIRKQIEAFRDGFNQVFPMEKLISFTAEEVQLILCGDQCPSWTAEDINNYTEPMLGYTRESPGFLRFVNVLCKMAPHERKAFLQFTTGCSSLPPGGLSNLHPRLTIVRKVDASDGSFPSVNTCVHYLKLPDYSSQDIMRERLLAATMEKGFHLN